ncbi:M48 family metalloprotease [bacterium]|nr:M48 family metalloprotease [bacterium]
MTYFEDRVIFTDFGSSFFISYFSWTDIFIILGLSLTFLGLHWTYAKLYGRQRLLKILNLHPPGKLDSCHQQFKNIVDEIRIACGLPSVYARIIPSGVFNSMALIDKEGTPIVALTEGIVSKFKRDELQAIVAHELAHIRNGDTFYIGFITSLINTMHSISKKTLINDKEYRTGLQVFYSFILGISSGMMRLLSCFISQNREFIADATAVEMTRNPMALARAIDKAHCNPSNLGLYAVGFTPLFIVSPDSEGSNEKGGFWTNLLSSHPPPKKRLAALLAMAHYPTHRFKHAEPESDTPIRLVPPEIPSSEWMNTPNEQLWKIRTPSGGWISGLSTETLVRMPWFTLTTFITVDEASTSQSDTIPKNLLKTGVPAKYVQKIKNMHQRKKSVKDFLSPDVLCPICRKNLVRGSYENVSVQYCPECSGKIVLLESIQTILIRQDVQFSETARKKAIQWYRSKGNTKSLGNKLEQYLCPCCSMPMIRSLYNVVYHIELDTCQFCRVVWFDQNELELLQILVEEANKMDHII